MRLAGRLRGLVAPTEVFYNRHGHRLVWDMGTSVLKPTVFRERSADA